MLPQIRQPAVKNTKISEASSSSSLYQEMNEKKFNNSFINDKIK